MIKAKLRMIKPRQIFLGLAIFLYLSVYVNAEANFTLISPLNNTFSNNTMPNFDWTDYDGTFTHYSLELSQSESFDQIVAYNTTNSQFQISSPLAETAWYWRVLAFDDAAIIGETSVFIYNINYSYYENVQFNITLNKTEYFLDETVFLTFTGPNNTRVNFSITVNGTMNNYSEELNTALYFIYLPDSIGEHRIDARFIYGELIHDAELFFDVIPPEPEIPDLIVMLFANTTTAFINEQINFNAEVSNAVGDVIYEWDFGDGIITTTDTSSISHEYEEEGEYEVLLNVKDDSLREAENDIAVTVSDFYDSILFLIKDDTTDEVIENADIIVNSTENESTFEKRTDANGIAVFRLEGGEYEYIVKKSKYEPLDGTIDLDGDAEQTLYLLQEKDKPEITINKPDNKQQLSSNNIAIEYLVKSRYAIDFCELHFNQDGVYGWRIHSKSESIRINKENSFDLNDLTGGKYKYEIKCVDSNENEGLSEIRYFSTPDLEQDESPPDPEPDVEDQAISIIDDQIRSINSIISDFESASGSRLEIVNSLGLIKSLEDSKKRLKELNENYNDLDLLDLDPSTLESKQDEITDKIKQIYDNTFKDVIVIETQRYILHNSRTEVEAVTKKYFESAGEEISENRLSKVVESNHNIDEYLSVIAEVVVAEKVKSNGEKDPLTFVRKKIDVSGGLNDTFFLEFIPQSINEKIVIIKPEGVLNDEFMRLDAGTLDELIYYIDEKIEPDLIKETKSLLMNNIASIDGQSSITGYSVFSGISQKGNILYLGVLTIIIIAGAAVFVLVKSGGKMNGLINKSLSDNPKSTGIILAEKLNQTLDLLNDNQHKTAFNNYDEILSLYCKVPEHLKNEFTHVISYLKYELEVFHISSLCRKAMDFLKDDLSEKASDIYSEIASLHDNLPDSHKEKISEKVKSVDFCIYLKSMQKENKTGSHTNILSDSPSFTADMV